MLARKETDMKTALTMTMLLAAMSISSSMGEELRISDFQAGELTIEACTSGKLYRVEWTPTLSSPAWSYDNPFLLKRATSNIVQTTVPTFYRAVELNYTNTVYGILYHGATPVTNHPVRIAPYSTAPGETNLYLATALTGMFGEYTFTNIASGMYTLIIDERVGNILGRSDGVLVHDADVRCDIHCAALDSISNTWPEGGATVTTNKPLFAWDPVNVPGVRYWISVFDTNWNQIAWATTPIPQHRFPDALEQGSNYIWEVQAEIDAPEERSYPWDIPYILFTHTCWTPFTVNLE